MCDPVIERFLRPTHALAIGAEQSWPASGLAETAGEDARCRIFVAVDPAGRMQAAFLAFGPPVVIACADWICERVTGQTVEFTRTMALVEVEKALALKPTQRYAGLVAIDALADAMVNLGR